MSPCIDIRPPEHRHSQRQRRVWALLAAAHLTTPLALLLTSLLLLAGVSAWALILPAEVGPKVLVMLTAVLALWSAWLIGLRLLRGVFLPLVHLEEAVEGVCQGEPNARVELQEAGILSEMVEDIESLNQEVNELYEDMDNRVARNTKRLAQKTASLKILYDVAASINQADSLDDLLLRFLRVLKEMVGGLAATVRLALPDGRMRLVGSIGLNDDVVAEHDMLPLQLCLCGSALSPGDILCQHDSQHCSRQLGRRMFGADEVEAVTVPLDYHGQLLGVYNLFVPRSGISAREDILDLLATIGNHLGMAVAKQRSDAEARRLSLIEERTSLAHELHDSLAQTLASLRFQVRMLEDSLAQSPGSTARDDLQRIRNGLDEAHTELRELLNNFRAPMDSRGLVPALDKVVRRFGKETGIHSFFQNECRHVDLTAAEELQMLRIVQEALVNIRKHAGALTVRVLLSCRAGNQYRLLVEDDGVGFENAARVGRPGEHIGLTIMEERARRLGGELRIESEKGEGTRLELNYEAKGRGDGQTGQRSLY